MEMIRGEGKRDAVLPVATPTELSQSIAPPYRASLLENHEV